MIITPLTSKYTRQFVDFRHQAHKDSTYVNDMNLYEVKDLLNSYLTKEKLAFIAVDIDRIVGQLFVTISEDRVFINLISVLNEYSGKGLADKLIEKAKSVCKQNKLTKIELIVNNKNERAIKFYLKQHFVFMKNYTSRSAVYTLDLKK